jgi:predicted SAM-dependent methyltransferase/glycosyltransferase involved in cell wall biosynthesis
MADTHIPAILLLDPLAQSDLRTKKLDLLNGYIPENIKIVVLTTQRQAIKSTQPHIQYVQVSAQQYAHSLQQLSNHPSMQWLMILPVSGQLANDDIDDLASYQKEMQSIGVIPNKKKNKTPHETPYYLNFGCQSGPLPGFINLDMNSPHADMRINPSKKLPWKTRTIDAIYSAHYIEYLSQADTVRMLTECRRLLKPGGIMRIVTTDLAAIVQDYVQDTCTADQKIADFDWTDNACERLNLAMRLNARQWLYDRTEMTRLARLVGLEVASVRTNSESQHPALANLDQPHAGQLVIELIKPERQLAKDAMPLVSITIPAYNPTYFQIALESAINQTYSHLDIVVSDDCPTERIREITESFMQHDPRIRYIRNTSPAAGKDKGGSNYLNCYVQALGEFVKYLNDDDVLTPNCVERMIDAFRQYPDVTLVTSKRQRIDALGRKLSDIDGTIAPVTQDSLLEGRGVAKAMMTSRLNFVGEPTTCMFKKSEVIDIKPNLQHIGQLTTSGMVDVCMWLNNLTKGDMVYLVEPLSEFRVHAEQVQVKFGAELHYDTIESWRIVIGYWDRIGLHFK